MRTPVSVTVSRIVLGQLFALAGASGFVFAAIGNLPPQPGLAGEFQHVFFASHWVLYVDGVEFVTGALLLSNRYIVLALTMLGAVLSNILVFHITMQPIGILPGAIATGLWFVLFRHYRTSFAPLFVKDQSVTASAAPALHLVNARRALAS
jgi:putative oxidoreductase